MFPLLLSLLLGRPMWSSREAKIAAACCGGRSSSLLSWSAVVCLPAVWWSYSSATVRVSKPAQEIIAAGLTEAYRFELIKLLKVAPAITEAVALDADGRERLKVSR